jgi:hypothetical protein
MVIFMRRLACLLAALGLAAPLTGCGSSHRAAVHPSAGALTPAQTRRAFAAAGIPLHAVTGYAKIGAGPTPRATLVGSHNQRPYATWVFVFRSLRDAIRMLHVGPNAIVDPSLRHLRVRNVVVEWREKQDLRITSAVMHLR